MTATELTCASAITAIPSDAGPDTLVVAANGYISRACHAQRNRPGTSTCSARWAWRPPSVWERVSPGPIVPWWSSMATATR